MNSILIAAGVYLSAKLIAFIAGELTESERQKQEEIDAEIRKIQRQIEACNPDKSSQTSSHEDSESTSKEQPIRKQPSIYAYLCAEATARETDYNALYKEINESLSTVRSVIKSKETVHTPLRKNSLELLYRQLCEAKEKCHGYQIYLQVYKEQIAFAKENDNIPVFWMQLPAAYPYVGKIIWLNSDQLTESPSIKYTLPDSTLTLNIKIEDADIQKFPEHQNFPVMITNSRWKTFSASVEKGMFKANELRNTHLGVTATVKEILAKPKRIILTYQRNLELCLPCNNLIKPSRFPLIRTTITVYPVDWNYYLSSTHKNSNEKTVYPVTVSERREDASSSLSFQSFPVCFTEEDFTHFTNCYKNNNLQDYNREFLIGPLDEDDVLLKKGAKLKLQLGDMPLCVLAVEESSDKNDQNRFLLRFDRLCAGSEKTFSADDIFMPFDVSITPYFHGTSNKTLQEYTGISNLDDVSAIIWDIFEEFRIQDKIKKEREGAGYFFKWENITNQLISVMEQSEPFLLDIEWLPSEKRNCIFAEVINAAELRRFIQSFTKRTDLQLMHEWQPEFFIKDDQGNHYEADINDYGQRIRIRGRHVLDLFYEKTDHIELFASNRPYAEYQQKSALKQFRIGQVINPQIQAACLNGASIKSNPRDDCQLAPFHNSVLYNNPTQCAAIERGFKEKNIFLIQGPPGSGKTTVIREIIEQVFTDNSEARILVVSQANVAVDTALDELIDEHGNQIVRCGIGSKISPKLQQMRLQTRCQEYLDALQHRKNAFDISFYDSWESTIFSNDSYGFSPVLCELIIRSHHLIGATCVGLAKRNIGLERAEFDLVIIDEAGKALPAELLIPLIRAKKAIIIGDQEQLPPVINPILYDEERIDLEERSISENELFAHSFFERLYTSTPETNKIMLDTQFRMPAVIGNAVSELFYGGTLKNGIGTEQREPVLLDANLNFINFDNDKFYLEKKENNSITNETEADAVVALIQHIRQKDTICKNRIAVITPYKGQKWLICNKLLQKKIIYHKQKIVIDTIDSFQGSQAEVVIYCCTRAQKPTLFFKDKRRLNVALSRARQELIILGKLSYFYRKYHQTDSKLPQLADYIKAHGNIIQSEKCQYLHYDDAETQQSTMLILPIEQIALPERYFLEEINSTEITKQIDEYDQLGYFSNPLVIKKYKGNYELVDGFAQYKAAQEMGLTGCVCMIQ